MQKGIMECRDSIDNLLRDLKGRVCKECDVIKKAANPAYEVDVYVRNIRWYEPELAAFLKKEMSKVLNLNN